MPQPPDLEPVTLDPDSDSRSARLIELAQLSEREGGKQVLSRVKEMGGSIANG